MQLPQDFEAGTRHIMGEALYATFAEALSHEPPVSIRLNRFKPSTPIPAMKKADVPWCDDGIYLTQRPNFTFDPLFHAGVYYVQEAASMFVHHIIRQHVHEPVAMLDLCAAPGGKSTCALGALPGGSFLLANEPMGKRAQILNENITKFGCDGVVVTNNYPADFQRTALQFDLILADVPCSGEGMFRKDPNAIQEWSAAGVEKCSNLQRSIISDIWGSLKPGGMLIYSTCTMNTRENEQNAAWIANHLGADFIAVDTQPCWNITGSLLNSRPNIPVCRFIPGLTQSEGLFVAVLRKHGTSKSTDMSAFRKKLSATLRPLRTLQSNDKTPPHSLAMSVDSEARSEYPAVEVGYPAAISYLRREAITLSPQAPRGIILVTFGNVPLGFAKNLGNRANNLYPSEWRIKSTHIQPYTPIINI